MQNLKTVNTGQEAKSIVDFIISERKKQKESNESHILEQLQVMNANAFFKVEDGQAIGNKIEFLSFIAKIKEDELRNLESFLNMMTTRTKFNIPPFPRKDKEGNDYYWIKTIMPNGIKEFKITLFEGMEHLIQGYLLNQYRFDLTLAELYEEAQKA